MHDYPGVVVSPIFSLPLLVLVVTGSFFVAFRILRVPLETRTKRLRVSIQDFIVLLLGMASVDFVIFKLNPYSMMVPLWQAIVAGKVLFFCSWIFSLPAISGMENRHPKTFVSFVSKLVFPMVHMATIYLMTLPLFGVTMSESDIKTVSYLIWKFEQKEISVDIAQSVLLIVLPLIALMIIYIGIKVSRVQSTVASQPERSLS